MHWKTQFEQALAELFPQAVVRWEGNDPYIDVPEETSQETVDRIVNFAENFWIAEGVNLKLESVKHVPL